MSGGVQRHTPASELRAPLRLARDIAAGFADGLGLGWQLFARDLRSRYRQSLLGYAWAVVQPLAIAGLWIFLHRQHIIASAPAELPYAVFALSGVFLWQGFADAVRAPLATTTSSRNLLGKVCFPHEALVVAASLDALTGFGLRLVVLVPLAALLGSPPGAGLPLALCGVLALAGLGLALGLLLVPVGLLLGDVPRGLPFVLQLWMYLTPVVYVLPSTGPAAYLQRLNPVSPALTATRAWLFGAPGAASGPLAIGGGVLILLVAAVWVYHVALPLLNERLHA